MERKPMKKTVLMVSALVAIPAAVGLAGDAKTLYEKDCTK
jgi:hypothetical protein